MMQQVAVERFPLCSESRVRHSEEDHYGRLAESRQEDSAGPDDEHDRGVGNEDHALGDEVAEADG